MPVMTIEELAGHLAPSAILIGLDLGTQTIGVAISDPQWRFAHPRPVLKRVKFSRDAAQLGELIRQEDVAAIILGLPLNMDGSEGPRAQATRAFARNFDRLHSLPIAFWDERLSTVAAERTLIDMNVSRAKRSERIDSAAAAFILQGALDRLRALRPLN